MKSRIRLELQAGQWTYWLNDEELKHYLIGDKVKNIKSVIVEETMSYAEYRASISGLAYSSGS